jgi:branched-chain amino acid transport system substrate-binding protein
MKFPQLFQRMVMGGLVLALVACVAAPAAQSGGGAGESLPPIKIGAMVSKSGPFTHPEVETMLQAYVDKVNAEGGIKGRRLEIHFEDDKTDPAASAAGARRLVDEVGVVAMVGSTTAMQCAVNAVLYGEKGVANIVMGVDPVCFNHPNISPVNNGPVGALQNLLLYAAENLQKEKVCVYLAQLPGMEPAYKAAIEGFEAATGKKLTVANFSFKMGDDATPFILDSNQSGCEATIFFGSDPDSIAWAKAIKVQNLLDSQTWMVATSAYTAEVAKALGSDANGLLTNSEFVPWSVESPETAAWRELTSRANVPQTAFTEGAYIAIDLFTNVLKGMEGEITRESVLKTFQTLAPVTHPMLGTPYVFGDAPTHVSVTASKIMVLQDGNWVEASPDWVDFAAYGK